MRTFKVTGIFSFGISQILLLILINSSHLVSCGNILFWMPLCSKSMKITFMPLAEELVNRGHEVSVVMPYPTKKPNPKITEIIVDGTSWDELQQRMSNEKLQTGASQVPPLFEIIEEAILVRKYKFIRTYLYDELFLKKISYYYR